MVRVCLSLILDQKTRDELLKGVNEHSLYKFPSSLYAFLVHKAPFDVWHSRFGHPKCDACLLGKLSKSPLASVAHCSQESFPLIYSNVWGPAPVQSNFAFKYFVILVEDFTRYTWIYFLKNKSEVHDIFIAFYALVATQFNAFIKAFHSDGGGEFQKLRSFFKQRGLVYRLTCPHTDEQNGVTERKIRHIVDTGLTLFAHSSVPFKY